MRQFPQQVKSTRAAEQISHAVSQLYTELQYYLPKPKSDYLNYLTFLGTYIIHKQLYDRFLNDRDLFTQRFVLDCYHIAISELNGLVVTDQYLQVSIDKIFSYRYLDYERVSHSMRSQQKGKFIQKDLTGFLNFYQTRIGDVQDYSQVEFVTNIQKAVSGKIKFASRSKSPPARDHKNKKIK